MTARQMDSNGWYEIPGNPLSKVGVFPYLGKSIDPNQEHGLDPEGVYNVYRSERELNNPETIDSFKLIPWIEEHDMLGAGGGQLMSPEDKGVDGVIGEDVYFADGFLRGNVKLFSESLADTIDSGKKELSCGYRCKYAKEAGVYGDKAYEFIQTDIRGNHVASVDAGRMGPEVAVLDHMHFTFDHEDFKPMGKAKTPKTLEAFATDGVRPSEFGDAIRSLVGAVSELTVAFDAKDEEEKAEDEGPGATSAGDPKSPDAGEDMEEGEDMETKSEDMEEEKAEDEEEEKGEDTSASDAMDVLTKKLERLEAKQAGGTRAIMKEIKARDALYAQVSGHVGAFDHSDMTAGDIAVYACDKIGLSPKKGHEEAALGGYFANRPAPSAFAQDSLIGAGSAESTGAVAKYLS